MIEGQRVALRAIEEEDLSLLQQMLNDREISRLVGGFSFPVALHEQREWLRRASADRSTQRWMVLDRETGAAVGLTGLWNIDWQSRHALTALKLAAPETRGKGLGTDAILTLAAYAFDQVGLHRLWSEILLYNRGSYRAYVEKAGFRVEGVNREHVWRDGRFHDQVRIGLLADEFAAGPHAAAYGAKPLEASVTIEDAHRAPHSHQIR